MSWFAYLMGDDKDKHGSVAAGLEQIWAGDNVLRQLDAREISMIRTGAMGLG
jgi:hypothetical protein